MPPPVIANRRIDPIVDHRNHSRAVPQKRPPPRHTIQHTIQPQLRRRRGRRFPQPFDHAPRAPERQGGQVGHAGAVAEVVAPAAGGQRRLGARQVREGGFVEGQVVEGLLVQAGEGVELGRVWERGVVEEGRDILGGGGIEGCGLEGRT